MKLILDTENIENMQLVLTEEDRAKPQEQLMEEFEYAMSSFFVSFCLKNNWDTEKAKEMKQSIFTKIDRHIANMFTQGVLEPANETVDEAYLKELHDQMAEAGFDEDEIEQMVELVKKYGSLEKASEYLESLAEEEGVELNQ
ncbi:MAG: hypothetical protein MJ055_03145 [Phascolarctobacterium sp.]|nr:hypothetical protein [Phascolarctobacterium sp.]